MECISPPSITEEQISMLLDGEANPDLEAHIATCPACARRVEEARQIGDMLFAVLRCPSPQKLGEYFLNMLEPDDREIVSHHLNQCESCQKELHDLEQFMASGLSISPPSPAASPSPRFPRLKLPDPNELIAALLPSPLSPATRGKDRAMFQAGELMVLLESTMDDDTLVLQGQLATEELASWAGALVQLYQAGHLQTAATVDDLGIFRCRPVASRPSQLRITSSTGRAVVFDEIEFPT